MNWWPLIVSGAGGAFLSAACVVILMPVVIRARWLGHDELAGVQIMHDVGRSRLGGAIVVVASLGVLAFAVWLGRARLSAELPLALSALPIIAVGLWEDLTHRVLPRYRLAAGLVSAALASVYASGVIPRIDIPLPGDLLQYSWVVLPLTWFMVVGACNAINLVDGAHGLAGGTALIMFSGLAIAAEWSGDARILAEALVMAGALVGFLAWNYPGGRVFLGDAGAYFVGFMYAQLSMRLIARNDDLSAWYVLMLAAYPVVETLFAMYRRGIVRGARLTSPDALHLHSLMFRRVALPIERRTRRPDRCRANARVAPRLWMHSAVCLALAVAFHDNTPALCLSFVAYALCYVRQYTAIARFRYGKSARRAAL